MRCFILLLVICAGLSCNSDSNRNNFQDRSSKIMATSFVCNQDYDRLLLKYANDFSPTTIDLNGSMSIGLKSFLLSIDTSCLRKQTNYKYFITFILVKLALNHLRCCNQYYDLYQMREGPAAIVINEFNRLGGYSQLWLEMLNSGLVVDYISNEKSLLVNPKIFVVMSGIEAETTRIKKEI